MLQSLKTTPHLTGLVSRVQKKGVKWKRTKCCWQLTACSRVWSLGDSIFPTHKNSQSILNILGNSLWKPNQPYHNLHEFRRFTCDLRVCWRLDIGVEPLVGKFQLQLQHQNTMAPKTRIQVQHYLTKWWTCQRQIYSWTIAKTRVIKAEKQTDQTVKLGVQQEERNYAEELAQNMAAQRNLIEIYITKRPSGISKPLLTQRQG